MSKEKVGKQSLEVRLRLTREGRFDMLFEVCVGGKQL